MMSIQMQLTLSLHYSYLRYICVYEFGKEERRQWLFVFVVLYKLSIFMHTVSVNLYSSTQSCVFFFFCLYLQTCTHGDVAACLGLTQHISPGLHSEPTGELTLRFLGFG